MLKAELIELKQLLKEFSLSCGDESYRNLDRTVILLGFFVTIQFQELYDNSPNVSGSAIYQSLFSY